MSKKKLTMVVCLVLLLGLLASCSHKSINLNPKQPITVKLWHNYNGQMQDSMDELIDEFNITIGRERGIIISVTSVAAMEDQEERLAMITAGIPGAEGMPDIVTAHPRTAARLAGEDLIVSLDDALFSSEELEAYVPQFLEEGRLSDGKLYVFPIAKSSEILFVNQTLFDHFSAATGVTLKSLSTFEGIAKAATKYYEWTDSLTPDISNDGKTFFMADSWGNISLVAMTQLGETFVSSGKLRTDLPQYERIWQSLVSPACSGAYAVNEGYSADFSLTGDIVCSLCSTAEIIYFGDTITYPDNTGEEVEYTILPYPSFQGAKKIALQRGAGMVIAKSEPKKEYAAALFLKWLSSTEQNMRFVASTGYLPVTIEAFNSIKALDQEVENPNIRKLREVLQEMETEYTFITAPNYEGYDEIFTEYEREFKAAMREGRQRVLSGESVQDVSSSLLDDLRE
ncbi:MAG TPA: extracellular solute-binding protein [Clostridiaceae bacterium]|nr:extracellular solute-binding protein [Clostridiaceae bacterium]